MSAKFFLPIFMSSISQYRCLLQKLAKTTSQYYFVLQKAWTKHFPVLLCTTKLAQSTFEYYFVLQSLQNTSQYYCVLQSLHKLLPSTTLHYKACTNYFPVLLCTTRLAQSPSQYYFVLQSLHKLLPSTTLHYKACTNYFPVLLCTTRLAQSPSQYYFVLQSLHKLLPSTTLYYKACTKSFTVLLCTTKLAQSTSQYCFVLQKACAKHFRLHQNHSTTSDLLLLYRKAYAAANIAVPCQQLPATERIFLWRLVAGTPAVPGPGATLAAVLPGLCNLLPRLPIRQNSLAQKHGRKQLHWKSTAKELDGSWPAQCHASFHVQNSSVVVRSSSLCMLRSPTNNWPSTCKACKVHNADSSSAKRCGWPSGLAVKCAVPIARMAPLPRSCTCTANNRRGDSGAKGDTDMRNLRMVAVFSSMQTSKGSALTLPRPMAVATSYPWLRAICNKSSTQDGVTSCKHKYHTCKVCLENPHLGSSLACSASQKSHVPLRSWHLHSNLLQAEHDSLLALRHTRPAPPHQHHCDDRACCICLSASYTTYGERAARAGNCLPWAIASGQLKFGTGATGDPSSIH